MWGKRKKESSKTSDRVALRMASGIHWMQTRFGEVLNKKTSRFTRQGKMVLLFAICLFFGGGSLYVLVNGLKGDRSPDQSIKPNAITVPAYADKSGEPASIREGYLTDREIKRIRSIRHYLDSLQHSSEGKKILDSIVRMRPGFMDSLAEVERLYRIDTVTRE